MVDDGVRAGAFAPARIRRAVRVPPLVSSRRRRRGLGFAPYAMVSPALLLLAALLAAPALLVFWLSLNASTYGQDATFVGLANYAKLLHDPIFWRAFVNTFAVVNLVVYGELLLGLGLAVLLAGWMPGKRLIIAVLIAPYAITETSGIVMWRYMIEPDVGLLTQVLARFGLGSLDWSTDPVQTLLVASAIAIWHHLPFTFLILYSALLALPRETLEAAEIDGAGPLQMFWRVTLPMLMPAVLIAVVFRTIFAIRMFSEVWLLTEGGPARLSEVLAIYLYRETFRYHEFGVASATGWCMLLVSVLIALPYLLRIRRQAPYDA
jgi:multiple sugar transport system permease protein